MADNMQAIDNQFEREATEMAFSVVDSRSINLSVDKPADKVCEFLGHRIARKPEDLLAHVQRIKLAARHNLDPFLKGALLDLNIALGPHGRDLRKSMLDLAASVLGKEAVQDLAVALDRGVPASAGIEHPGVSVLCKGITGRVDFIEASSGAEAKYDDPMEQALASIESSQLDVARQVLEDAVHAGVSDADQQALLLDLYLKTDDKLHFSVLYSSLDEAAMDDAEAWLELAKHFGVDDE